MTTSGTAGFNLDVAELCEEAFERCGSELRSGYDLRTARRSLNLLTVEWANRGINLWTIEQGAIPLVAGQATYNLPVDTIDLMDMVIRTGTNQNQTDINISRIAEPTYSTIPNKNAQGRPIQVWVERLTGATTPTGVANPRITVWPVPDNSQPYTFVYWRLRRIQDAGSGGTKTMDIPFRFLNCMVAGLAFYLAMKIQGVDPNRALMLKQEYEQQLQFAQDEDREKAPIRLVPRSMFY
jgi:hypothetical protein